MKKLFMFMLMAMILSISGWSQETVTIGTGTTTQDYVPTYTYYGNSATQTIYLATEVGMGGEISSISYYAVNNSTTRNVVIYMGETTLSTFSSVGDAITDLTQVYSGSVTFTAGGWTTITFETPFVYSGSNNLVVGVRDITNSYDAYGSYPSWQSTSETSRSIYSYRDNTPIEFSGMSSNAGVSNNIPNIQLTISPIEGDFCYAPATITVGGIEANAATVSWTMNENNPDASVNLQYALASADWDDEDAVTTVSGLTGTETTLSDLTPNTAYKVRIQADCGSSLSAWKSATFRTACSEGGISDFPWEEGFESNWTTTSILGTLAPDCWAVYNGGATSSYYDWKWGYSTTSHSGSGAAACYTDNNYGPENHNDWLVSPLLSLDGNKMLSFWAQRANSTTSEPDEISIWISDEDIDLTAPASSSDPLPGFTQIYQTDIPEGSWQLYEIPLAGYSGNRYIAFVRRNAPTDGYYLRLDDVKVDEMPECTRPINLATLESTENSVTLSWDEVENAESYTLYYKNAASSEDYIAVEDVAWGEDGYVLEGLTASTTYEWTLAVVCGGSELPSLEVAYASTTCATITEFPWEEGFELDWLPNSILSSTSAPLCWAVYNGGATSSSYDWKWGYSTTSHSGNGAAACYTDYNDGPENHNDWLVSPLLSLDGNKMLSFYAQRANSTTSEPDEISIWISDEDIDLTAPASSSDPLPGFTQIYQTDIPEGSWQLYEIPLAGYSGNRYIAFVRRNAPTDGYYLRLDDVKVDELPECTRPTITSLAVTPTDVTIAWTSTGENFQIAYGTSAGSLTNIVTMEDDIIQAADEENTYTATIEGLTPNTQYYYKVIAICDETTQLETVEKTFSTPCMFLTLEDLPKTWDLESDNVSYGGSSYYLLPSCWSRTNSSYPYAYNYNAHGGSYSLYWSYTASTVVLTPVEMDANTLELSLWARGAVPFEVGVMTNSADESTFTPLHSIIPTDSYTLYTLSLFNYQGEGHFIAIRSTSSSGSLYIDDITLDLIPECSAPIITAGEVTSNSVALTLTPEDAEYVAAYKLASDPDEEDSWIPLTIEGNTIEISELSPATSYTLRAATVCGEEEYSSYSYLTVTTDCAVLTEEDLPKTWDFEAGNLGGTTSYPLPACWNRITTSSYTLYPYVSSSNAYGGSKDLYFYANYTSYAVLSELSEDVDVSTLQLSLYAYASSATSYNNTLEIGVMTNPADAATFTLVAATETLTGSYQMYEIPLSGYEGAGRYIAIRNATTSSYNYSDIYIDDVTLGFIPACSRPVVSNVETTGSEATITWNSTGTDFSVYYRLAGSEDEYILWEGTSQETENEGEYTTTITDLQHSSQYQFYVAVNCSEDEVLESNVGIIATQCMVITVTDDEPFIETFDTYTTDFGCWTDEVVSGSSQWDLSNVSVSGKSAHRTYTSGAKNRLVSPVLDVTAMTSPALSYNWEVHSDGANLDSMYVYYRISEEEDWTQLMAHGPNANNSASAITQYTLIPLPEEALSSTLQVAFLAVGHNGYGVYLDNVAINSVACLPPAEVTVTNVTVDAAEITWVGDADSFVLSYRKTSESEWTDVENAESPYTIEELDPQTDYVVKVAAVCEGGVLSWSQEAAFRTACSFTVVTDETPYVQGFTAETDFSCWTFTSDPSDNNWEFDAYDGALYHSYNSGTTADAISPIFNIEDVTTPYVKFTYSIETYSGGVHNNLEVLYRSDLDADWTTLKTYNEVVSDAVDSIPLPNPSATYQINFRWSEPDDDANGIYITALTVYNEENAPTCFAPTNLTVTEITSEGATLSWSQFGTTSSWNVYVKESTEETYGTPTPVSGEPTYTLTDLDPFSTYNVYVAVVCDEEEMNSSVVTFTTACVTITDFSYTESFEGNSLGCWLSNPVDAEASNWTTSEYYYSSSTAPADGSYCAYLYLNNNNAYHHAQLLSPTFDLSSIGNPTLTFSHIQKAWGSDQDTLGLYYRTSAAGEWTYLTSWSSNINTWQNETITLPEPSAEYQLMFLGAIHYGYGVGIDNITIDGDGETPEPVQPTVVTNAATSVTQTTAVLNGEITSLGNQTITARGFEWKLATATDYTVVSATGTTMTATLTGLTANTTYTYKAFATTALGTVYGSELTFTTLEQGEEPCTPVSMTIAETVCFGETYTFNGQTYNATGTYTTTVAGQGTDCDTNYTINLTVLPQNTASETVTVCAGATATFNGQTLTEGTNTITVAGQGTDCDTLYTVTLVVLQPTSSTTDVTVCYGETYEFNGQTYSATGTYTATLTNAAGCDSVATLNLTVRPANDPIEETVTLNNDELPYTWRGEQYTEFGTYTVAGEDENGCPQEYVLTLVHNSGIAEVENEYSIALYPNPTSENATLSVKGLNEEAIVIVTDQAGRVISTTKLALGQETMEVETSKLASGVYYIRIQTANSVRTEKLIRK